jgi:hypothetical protein
MPLAKGCTKGIFITRNKILSFFLRDCMSFESTGTVTRRYKTENPRIVKVITGTWGPSRIIIAKRIYFEVDIGERKIFAIDWFSAIASLYDFEEADK